MRVARGYGTQRWVNRYRGMVLKVLIYGVKEPIIGSVGVWIWDVRYPVVGF